MSWKYFSWRSSSFWARTRILSLEVKMRSHGFQASTKRPHPRQPGSAFRISALDLIGLQADSSFEVPEDGIFRSVIHLDLLVVVVCPQTKLAEPVVQYFSGCPWSPQQMTWTHRPSSQSRKVSCGAGYCADLVPDDYTGNELLPHPFERPLCLATPAEEAVVGLAPLARISFAKRWVGVKTRDSSGGRARSLAWFCRCPRHLSGSSSDASTAGRRGAARRGAGSEVLFCCFVVRLSGVGCMFHGHVELPTLVTPLGWGGRGKVPPSPKKQDAHMSSPQLHIVRATYASTPWSFSVQISGHKCCQWQPGLPLLV